MIVFINLSNILYYEVLCFFFDNYFFDFIYKIIILYLVKFLYFMVRSVFFFFYGVVYLYN